MPARTKIALVMTCAAFAASGGVGCQNSSTHRNAVGDKSSFDVSLAAVSEQSFSNRHQFYYYPQSELYRDCDQDRWLWSGDGGVTWAAGPRLPATIAWPNEIPFAISLAQDHPASDHPAIAAAYPADGEAATAHVNQPQ